MPPAKKAASRRSGATRKRPAAKEPAAIKRLDKSLDAAQDSLVALRKDLSRDVGAGRRDFYKNLERFVGEARRDSGKLSKALERDVGQLQKQLARSSKTKSPSRKGTRRKAAGRSTARRPTPRSASRSRSKIAGLAGDGSFLLPSRGTALVPTDASYVSGSSADVDAWDMLDAPGSTYTAIRSAGGRKVAGSNRLGCGWIAIHFTPSGC